MLSDLDLLQIRLILFFNEGNPQKRTVTQAAREFNMTKVAVTRVLDVLERKGIVERTPSRKTVLTAYGEKLASEYRRRLDIAERYMIYQDLTPPVAKSDAYAAITYFSDDFMKRLQELEEQTRVKEFFSGRRSFTGGELCEQLCDGSYFFPFVIYREHMKSGTNLSMSNQGFQHPCELIVKDGQGILYLTTATVQAASAQSGMVMEGRVNRVRYYNGSSYLDAGMDGRHVYFPANLLNFIAMGKGRSSILHGSICLKMQCSVGAMHMPEGNAIFTMFVV